MKKLMGVVSVLALTAGLLFAGSAPAGASSGGWGGWGGIRIVHSGQSIQSAIDAAGAGGTVLVLRGTYREHVVITERVNLLGFGATLVPPSGEAPPNPCSFGEPAVDGICVAGDFTANPETGELTISRYVKDVKIAGLKVVGFAGTGINQVAGRGSKFIGNIAKDNVEYGIAAFSSTGTSMLFNTATGSDDAGFYVGDSPDADATLLGNRAADNLLGFFVRNAEHGTIGVNRTHDNCVGMLFLGDAPGPAGAFSVVANDVSHNTKACPAGEGPPFSGVGIGIQGAHDVDVRANRIVENVPSGPTAATGGVVLLAGFGGTGPSNNRVTRNAILRNSTDIVWDGSGIGNVLQPNSCETSDPAGLC